MPIYSKTKLIRVPGDAKQIYLYSDELGNLEVVKNPFSGCLVAPTWKPDYQNQS